MAESVESDSLRAPNRLGFPSGAVGRGVGALPAAARDRPRSGMTSYSFMRPPPGVWAAPAGESTAAGCWRRTASAASCRRASRAGQANAAVEGGIGDLHQGAVVVKLWRCVRRVTG